MTSRFLQKIGKKSAIISFAGGILIFLFYYFTADDNFIFGGLIYLAAACLFNLTLLILVLIRAYKEKEQQKGLFNTAGLMCLNIPVALFILWFGGVLLNTMRITIVNSTLQDISEIVIEGCQKKTISTIKAGESKTIWVKIPGECGIFMTYKKGTIQRKEEVVGYLSRLGGGKVTHKVGTNDIRE